MSRHDELSIAVHNGVTHTLVAPHHPSLRFNLALTGGLNQFWSPANRSSTQTEQLIGPN